MLEKPAILIKIRREICQSCGSSRVSILELFEGLFTKRGKLNERYKGGDSALDHEPVHKICKCPQKCLVCQEKEVPWNSWTRVCKSCDSENIAEKDTRKYKNRLMPLFEAIEKRGEKKLFFDSFKDERFRNLARLLYFLWIESEKEDVSLGDSA